MVARRRKRSCWRKVASFYSKHNKCSIEHLPSTNNLFAVVVSDEDGDPGEDLTSDKDTGGEQEEPSSRTGAEDRRETGAEEFIDEEHESQFCLETNFTEEEEETDRAPEHKDSTGNFMSNDL